MFAEQLVLPCDHREPVCLAGTMTCTVTNSVGAQVFIQTTLPIFQVPALVMVGSTAFEWKLAPFAQGVSGQL